MARNVSRRVRAAGCITALLALVATAVTTQAASAVPSGRPTAGPTLSTSDRLALRRSVTAGTRAYDIGTEDGRYPVMGFHTRGEMGGIWTPPLKLLDGLWFGVNGSWVGPATSYTRGYGYSRYALPAAGGVTLSRTDVAPDGARGVLVGLTLRAQTARSVTLTLDAHSELMSVYPWGESTPSQLQANLPDTAVVAGDRLQFTDRGTPPGGLPAHDWAATVGPAAGSPLTLVGSATGSGFRGPQEGSPVCPASGPGAAPAPDSCADTAYGKGAGGELRYRVTLPAGRDVRAWFVVAGSESGPAGAVTEARSLGTRPDAALAAKVASRVRLAASTRLSLPGDPALARSIDWSKQDLADLRQEAHDLQLRVTNAGTAFPAPVATLPVVRFTGAGFPDYPWLFGTDGEYTAYALVGLGRFAEAENHLRALREVSDVVNARSGKIVHEVVTDGSVYFGANNDNGNTDETVKFPSAVALVWRWTGDDTFRDEMYDASKRAIAYATTTLDTDKDGWPEGAGNVERDGQGAEKVDNAVYLIRGLLDLADMADSRHDTATATSSRAKAAGLLARFENAWWFGPTAPAYADSLANPTNAKLFQRYWTGLIPLEAELPGQPGVAVTDHALATLALHETSCFTGPYGLFHTGTGATTATLTPPQPTASCAGDTAVSAAPDERDTFPLNTAIAAVAEGNYGRIDQALRYAGYEVGLQFATSGDQGELAGAIPERAGGGPNPPYYGSNLGNRLTERGQVEQAWNAYGTVWPVVHQLFGVSPSLGTGTLAVVPQLPSSQPVASVRDLLLGAGSADVAVSAGRGTYRVQVVSRGVRARLTVGYVLPAGAVVSAVTLNGRPVASRVVTTHRGRELRVDAGRMSSATLVIRTR